VIRGLVRSGEDPFVRTPKKGEVASTTYLAHVPTRDLTLKVLLAATMAIYFVLALANGYYGSLPFIALFGFGYGGLGLHGLSEYVRDRMPPPPSDGTDPSTPDRNAPGVGQTHGSSNRTPSPV
jgi:hypothetical protein